MKNSLNSSSEGTRIDYEFTIIDTNSLDGSKFLLSQDLDVQLFGLLSDVSRVKDLDAILENLIKNINLLDSEKKRVYLGKLTIVSYVRRFHLRLMEVFKQMGVMIDPKELPFGKEAYIEGIEKGRAEGRAEDRAEGRAEGRAEAIQNLIIKQIARRFFTEKERIDSITSALQNIKDANLLESLFEVLLSVNSLEEFEEKIKEIKQIKQ